MYFFVNVSRFTHFLSGAFYWAINRGGRSNGGILDVFPPKPILRNQFFIPVKKGTFVWSVCFALVLDLRLLFSVVLHLVNYTCALRKVAFHCRVSVRCKDAPDLTITLLSETMFEPLVFFFYFYKQMQASDTMSMLYFTLVKPLNITHGYTDKTRWWKSTSYAALK